MGGVPSDAGPYIYICRVLVMTVSGKGSVPRYNPPIKVYHPSAAKASITPFLKLVNWVVGKHDKQVIPQMVPYLMVTYQGCRIRRKITNYSPED